MAIVDKGELIKRITARFGDDNSDEVIQLAEDLTDTFNNYDSRLNSTEDWEAKFKENDEMWRKKYKERFLEAPVERKEVLDNPELKDDDYNVTFDDLFKERED